MDIDLLAKMVKEVIMDHDSVTLPGVGCFVTEVVPASFTDKGYTIHPPYRRLFFSPRQGEDTLLVSLYARSNNISEEDATRILVEFLSEMKEVLKVRKTIVFPGLGRLRATRENHFFFVADEDLDIYPAGFGLESLSLKTHEETKEEVAEAVSNLADMLEAPAPEPVIEPEPVIPGPDRESPEQNEMADQVGHDDAVIPDPDRESPDQEENDIPELVTVIDTPDSETVSDEDVPESRTSSAPEPEPAPVAAEADTVIPGSDRESPEQKEMADQVGHDEEIVAPPAPAVESKPAAPEEKAVKSDPALVPEPKPAKKHHFWRILLIIAIVILVAVIVLAVLGRVAPEWLDKFLYSEEELRILHG